MGLATCLTLLLDNRCIFPPVLQFHPEMSTVFPAAVRIPEALDRSYYRPLFRTSPHITGVLFCPTSNAPAALFIHTTKWLPSYFLTGIQGT
jgi:hypothetical protein